MSLRMCPLGIAPGINEQDELQNIGPLHNHPENKFLQGVVSDEYKDSLGHKHLGELQNLFVGLV